MKRFFEENTNDKELGLTMLTVPEGSKRNSYSKPLDSLDLYPRSQSDIGKVNEELE